MAVTPKRKRRAARREGVQPKSKPRSERLSGYISMSLLEMPYDQVAHPGARCLECRGELELHQPDPSVPERMLATCSACKTWYLLDAPSADSPVVMIVLPRPGHPREVLNGRAPCTCTT
jgi:hypothetical protein